MRGATKTVECAVCKKPFQARVADRKRGWGKFCSKSCKAIKQTQNRRKAFMEAVYYGGSTFSNESGCQNRDRD